MKINIKSYNILFILVVFSQTLLLLYFMKNKDTFFCDEIYSYSLANSKYGTLFTPNGLEAKIYCFNKWISGNYIKDYISVSCKSRFHYSNPYYNQIEDSHPPFYYYILHSVCSLFPKTFSKWYGFSINIVSFILIQFFIYTISNQIFKSEKYALLACFIYGFSAASVDCHNFIRMYSLITLLYILLFYLYLKCLDYKFSLLRFLFIILIITVGGLTHYHFFVYAFWLTLVFIIILFINKNFKMIPFISVPAILGVILSYSYFPYLFEHIKNSPRGTEALNIESRVSAFIIYFSSIIKELLGFNSYVSIIIILLLFFIISIIIINKVINKYFNDLNINGLKLNFISLLIYIGFIYHTINFNTLGFYHSGRFLFSICPLLTIIIISFLLKINKLPLNLFVVFLSISSTFFMLDFDYQKQEDKYSKNIKFEELIKGNNLIVVTDYIEAIQSICPQLAQTNKTYIIPHYINSIPLSEYYPKDLPKSGRNYIFVLLDDNDYTNYNLPLNKVLDGNLFTRNTKYEIYEIIGVK